MTKVTCDISGKEALYYLGVAEANKYKAAKVVGAVFEEKVSEGINKLMSQAFGTNYWAVVMDLNKNIIYHSFESDQDKLSAELGWSMKLKELKVK